jgi:hypothetical protein
MKGLFYLFCVLVLGTGSVSGQVIGFPPLLDSGRILISGPKGGIKTMAPDRMPCLVPDVTRVERMPILRPSNADPMPNGFRRERGWSLEVRPAGK